VGKVAYKLQLPEESQIHPIFHVSLLKKAVGTEQVNPALPSLPKEGKRVEEPKAILDRRVIYSQGAPLIQVLVKWKEGSVENNSWEYLLELLKQFSRAARLLMIS